MTSHATSMTFGRTVRPDGRAAWRRAGRSIWRALEAIGQDRARRELLRQAMLRGSLDPALARLLRETAQSMR